MKKEVLDRVSEECKKLHTIIGKTFYSIPDDETIIIGENTIIRGIYIGYENYPCIPYVKVYLEVADTNCNISLEVMSDEIGWQIIRILSTASEAKRYYANSASLYDILDNMKSYISDAPEEEIRQYFKEIINTGFFHNAIGKVIHCNKDYKYIDVMEEY